MIGEQRTVYIRGKGGVTIDELRRLANENMKAIGRGDYRREARARSDRKRGERAFRKSYMDERREARAECKKTRRERQMLERDYKYLYEKLDAGTLSGFERGQLEEIDHRIDQLLEEEGRQRQRIDQINLMLNDRR